MHPINICALEAEQLTGQAAQMYHVGLIALTGKRCCDASGRNAASAFPKQSKLSR